jgi:tRNA(Ile)-lysidine synthase
MRAASVAFDRVRADNFSVPGVIESVRAFLTERGLREEAIGVAVSGGRDSMALLEALHALSGDFGLTLHVLHYDHALRAESGLDARFVEAAAARLGLAFHSERAVRIPGASVADTGVADTNVADASVSEDDARRERHAFFSRMAVALRLAAVATAHTADDQAETVLFRLLRGSGTRGLAGIPPIRQAEGFVLIRPLLKTRRAEVAAFLEARGVGHREDATNARMRFARNRIRHRVLPFLAEHGGADLVEALCRIGGIARAEDEYLEAQVDEEMERWRRTGAVYSRSVAALASLHSALRARVFMRVLLLCDVYPAFETVDTLERVFSSGGRADLARTKAVWTEAAGAERVIAIGRPPPEIIPILETFPVEAPGETLVDSLGLRVSVVRHPHTGRMTELRRREPRPVRLGEPWRATALLDAGAIEGRLLLRTRRPGDRMTPFGMEGTKKLHDVFIDEKVSLAERDRWPILCDDRGILWVVGLKQDERTRVTDATEQVLRIDVDSRPAPVAPEDAA